MPIPRAARQSYTWAAEEFFIYYALCYPGRLQMVCTAGYLIDTGIRGCEVSVEVYS